MSDRLKAILTRTGYALPEDYAMFLRRHRCRELADGHVSSNPDYWGVREIFEIGDGPKDSQVDVVYEQLKDVLPPFSFPIAQDWAGNLYLMDLTQGNAIVWWNHEPDLTDHHVDKVADTFSLFLSLIREG